MADDDGFFRLALASIITSRHAIERVTEASSFKAARDIISSDPSVSIGFFDLDMPGMNRFICLSDIRRDYPSVKVVVVSGSANRDLVLAALAAGVHGYISKTAGPGEVSRAVGVVLSGDIFVPASVALLSEDLPLPTPAPTKEVLTPRQTDVLRLLTEGASNRQIAARLDLKEGTIKIHVAGLLRALGVGKRAEAAKIGLRLLNRGNT